MRWRKLPLPRQSQTRSSGAAGVFVSSRIRQQAPALGNATLPGQIGARELHKVGGTHEQRNPLV